jgi:hypothetical protein
VPRVPGPADFTKAIKIEPMAALVEQFEQGLERLAAAAA